MERQRRARALSLSLSFLRTSFQPEGQALCVCVCVCERGPFVAWGVEEGEVGEGGRGFGACVGCARVRAGRVGHPLGNDDFFH